MLQYFKMSYRFLKDIWHSRHFLFQLARNDFKARYIASHLGIFWAFVQPILSILIFWFVFDIGFKSKPVGDFPFILWMTSGLIVWYFFADALNSSANSIVKNSFLVKKIVFRTALLPLIAIMSPLIIHAIFILLILGLFILYGYIPSLYWLQILYYLLSTISLLLGLAWLTSSIAVFAKDTTHVVSVILQFGFWLTPILWSIDIIPKRYADIIALNPIFYLIQGYRDSLIDHVWFWEKPIQTSLFWVTSLFILFIGSIVFRRLKPHFADVI